MTINTQEALGRFERVVYLSLSTDAESKAAGEAKQYKVNFILEAGWTVEQLVDKLLTVTTSPRVAFQNANRLKDTIPAQYIVPKAGQRVTQTMSEDEMLDMLVKKYGAEAIEKLQAKMSASKE